MLQKIIIMSLLILTSATNAAGFKTIKSKGTFVGINFVRYETENFIVMCNDGGERLYAKTLEKTYKSAAWKDS